jgi:hypothetical protein
MVVLMGAMRWLLSPTGSLIAGVVVLFGFWQVDRYSQRQKGASAALVRVQEADKRNVSKADDAARKSRAGSSGVRDPYLRSD